MTGGEVELNRLEYEMAAREYADFLAKFDAKKTTDDCFTPPAVFAAVHQWAAAEYRLQGRRIVRPFHPGGDFLAFEYQPGDVVLDNPPFSIIAKIRRFYDEHGIDYFLFAPSLTLFSIMAPTMLVVDETVEYANGAKVATSFITSLEPHTRVRTAPALAQALRAVRPAKAALPKYVYPDNVRNAALLGRVSSVDFRIPVNECEIIPALDSQRDAGKTIFGYGIIMSAAKAAELKAAELKDAVEYTEWSLSPREQRIIERLNTRRAQALEAVAQAGLFADEAAHV